MQVAWFSRSWSLRSYVDQGEPNGFTGSRKEFIDRNSAAWIWTVDHFLALQSAAPDRKSVDDQSRATPDDG